jgi:hypothetical protein
MKLTFLLLLFFISPFFSAFSQQNNIAFAITGQESSNFNWTDIRTIDMTSGVANATLFENGKTKFSFLDAETMTTVDQVTFSGNTAGFQQGGTTASANKIIINNPSPTALMSAAIAYDKRHDKLFFASMHTGQLIWLDLRSNTSQPVFYTIQKKLVNNADFNDESFNITRMTIGADGNGYALTNDGNHLIRFTTGNKVIITDLGGLIDDENNNGISVHNKCSSWGGDIVGDAFGKLYLFSASRNVFVIDPETKLATYKGTIGNLSATFSVNGAAVIDDYNVIVSTANTFEGFYKVNINDLSAIKIITPGKIYNASDLASCNLLHQQEKLYSLGEPALKDPDVIGNRFISVYPNPVTDGQVKITFDGNVAGKYKILLSDVQGRFIISKEVYVKGPGQVENLQTRTKQASGMYMIKIIDESGKPVFADKLFFQ